MVRWEGGPPQDPGQARDQQVRLYFSLSFLFRNPPLSEPRCLRTRPRGLPKVPNIRRRLIGLGGYTLRTTLQESTIAEGEVANGVAFSSSTRPNPHSWTLNGNPSCRKRALT
ncbi:hypothetical protein VTK56DRAFT_8611 [Thermocarpiscus australiensis]